MTSNQRIMIVDDEFLTAMALGEYLADNGFEIVGPFASSNEAMKFCDTAKTDAAFLDINLGDGETSEQIAKQLDDLGIPFVFLTGYSEIPSKLAAFEGAKFIAKPVPLKTALSEATRLASISRNKAV